MPVTNYFTVDNEILGESTAGVRTDYLADALGSVVGTVSQTGSLQNTYAYKPYGNILSKTGSATDPAFQWAGAAGYRSTGLSSADTFVRARHYSPVQGMWTTVDPTWPNQPAYLYVLNNPVSSADPSGLARGVRITVDDTPHRASTGKLIDGFTRAGLSVGWFMIGKGINAAPDLLTAIVRAKPKHMLGNHTMHHCQPFCPAVAHAYDCGAPILTLDLMVKEWCDCHKVVKDAAGTSMQILRSPGGAGWQGELSCRPVVAQSIKLMNSRNGTQYHEVKGFSTDEQSVQPDWVGISGCFDKPDQCKPWQDYLKMIDNAVKGAPPLDNNIILHDAAVAPSGADFIDAILAYIRKNYGLLPFP